LNIDQIIARSRPGDTAVIELIVDEYQVRLYDLAYSMLRDEAAANDAVQDTFIKVYERLHTFQGQSAFETWLIAIATNCCRDHLRRRQVRRALSLDNLTPAWLRRLARRDQQPEVQFERNERRRKTWALVDKLDERLRITITLRYRYGYSCPEIGELLGIATTTVYDRLGEGRRRLVELSEAEGSDVDLSFN
jgi:RNA polymerase sigma-70 factor, ECF subfamily